MIFIDTGAFVSRYVASDQYNDKSVKKWEKIIKSNSKCVTSNFVLDETFTLLGRRTNYQFAAEKASIIYSSGILEILRPDKHDELNAIEYFTKYHDQKVSYTDCISFVLMKKFKVRQIFTFDRHFSLAGFNIF